MSSKRNLIIVLGHGLRADVVGDHETWPIITPHFNALASNGLQMVATSACPSDQGGLLSLLTGLHARQHGHVESSTQDFPCTGWPAMLKEAGYYLAGVGQVGHFIRHLDQYVLTQSVAHCTHELGCTYLNEMDKRSLLKDILLQRKQRQRSGPFHPDRLWISPEDDIDGYIGEHACLQLEQMPTDQPWALIVSFSGPANDLPAPVPYDALYNPDELSDFVPADFTAINDLIELDYPRVLLQNLDRINAGNIRASYLGRVSLIDVMVGKLTNQSTIRSDANRIWTVLSSDRGELIGDHGLIGHRSFLAPAIEVPFIITPPQTHQDSQASSPTPKAITANDLISTVDVAATIAHLGNADLSHIIRGRNLLPLLTGQPIEALPMGILSEFSRRLMLETETHKLVFDTETRAPLALYDLQKDPKEQVNLVSSQADQAILKSLRSRLGDMLMDMRSLPQ